MQKRHYPLGILILALCIACIATPALSQAIESRAALNQADHPVFENTFSNSPDILKGALLARLQKDRIPAKSKKNTISCKGVVYPIFSSSPLDLYFQVEGKSKKKKGPSILLLFISKGKDNFIGKEYDPELSQKALDFLNTFQKDVDLYALKQDIAQKEKDLKKAQSKYEKRLKDKQKLTKKEYDLKRTLSGTQDSKTRHKTRKKLRKTNKRINSVTTDIQKAENDLEQQKGEIQTLKNQLTRFEKD